MLLFIIDFVNAEFKNQLIHATALALYCGSSFMTTHGDKVKSDMTYWLLWLLMPWIVFLL